ncbi:hypothetical protein BCR39DRAFT_524873 [Naematelia encephala]|uniref:C2H2-type domain-containing protein n=1 Tax=Naematelia encephala TaxID=71784 RepID=A0A1Y2BAX8_9TREE|nr:hypothetical protein BCR39DRAFT_524873 [Naematelia encephala]
MPSRPERDASAESISLSPEELGGGGGRRGKDGGKDKETFGCPYPGCGQSYSRMEYLKRHQRKHQDVRPFSCKDCSKAFARSDVLLRHRRRCHPTPPPADRNSQSPPPVHRGYPGVPVSSSRNDIREASPVRGRKHPRQSSGEDQDARPAVRLRSTEGESDLEDSPYESDRFRTGASNGGVYGVTEYPYQTDDSATYTPHLLPMFQQNQQYHNMNNPDHLEDASVLLSMAYPSGFPSSGSNGSAQPQRVPDVPDWAGGQTINMMMEAASAHANGGNTNTNTAAERDRSSSIASKTSENQANGGEATLTEAMGNFLGAMNWLGAGKEGSTPGEGASNGWPAGSPKPLSPFPISSLFSPSAFGIPSLPDPNATNGDGDDEANADIYTLLNQLAAYDVPQTRSNPNPERPLLRLAHRDMVMRAGEEAPKSSRFHLPGDRFHGCYQIPHWALPPLKTLSLMASRTFHTVLNHFSFVHSPTFRLVDTAACLAFAICTVGGIKSGKHKYAYHNLLQRPLKPGSETQEWDGPVPPGGSWESMYKENYEAEFGDADAERVVEWENGPIVRNEKSNMLVKSFALAQGVLMTEYNTALLQALVLYNAPYFLSDDEAERTLANMFMGTIASIARQIGFYTEDLEHFDVNIQIPSSPYTPNDLDLYWRRWIQLETRRRTAYLVYHLDTVSSLESNVPPILSGCEISLMPLPAPDTLWKAETAEQWLAAAKKYKPMTLDEAMRRMFYLPTYGAFDTLHEKADTKYYNLLNETEYGPFARSAMILTLLRGLIDIGEGKRDRGDWRDLTDLWVGCSWLRPAHKMLDQSGNDLGGVTRECLRARFAMGLEKWRQGWDFDPLCLSPGQKSSTSTSPTGPTVSPPLRLGDPHLKLNYCEEALPFYWLALALLNILNQAPTHEPGWNVFGTHNGQPGIKYGDMLKSARMFTRMGEGTGCHIFSCVASSMHTTPNGTSEASNTNNPTSVSAVSDLAAFEGMDGIDLGFGLGDGLDVY